MRLGFFGWVFIALITAEPAEAFFYHQELKDAKDDWGVTHGESFYYDLGSYKYRMTCRFNAPKGRQWRRIGPYLYRSLEPLSICFACGVDDDGDPGSRDERCWSSQSLDNCDEMQGWPRLDIPVYEDYDGSQIEIDVTFWTHEKHSWAHLSKMYCSCVGIVDDGSSRQSEPVPCLATIGGLGWDYSNWVHWIILLSIVLGSIQVCGIVGMCMREAKDKNLRSCSQIFVCQYCVITPLFKVLMKLKKNCLKGKKKSKSKKKKKK